MARGRGAFAQSIDEPKKEEILPSTVTTPQTETASEPTPATSTVTAPQPITETTPSTTSTPSTETVTDTDTLTVTSPLIKPTDPMHRMIGYYTEKQKNWIKKKAKKYRIKEAEIMRIALEELIKSGKI